MKNTKYAKMRYKSFKSIESKKKNLNIFFFNFPKGITKRSLCYESAKRFKFNTRKIQ